MKQSLLKSELHGINIISTDVERIYSIGVGTGAISEQAMAATDAARQITATTVDPAGLAEIRRQLSCSPYGHQIETKLEDATGELPHPDESFDHIHARLVFHFLSKQQLPSALRNTYRILRPGGLMYVVVRSAECPEASAEGVKTDKETGFTTYITDDGTPVTRYFHTQESISSYLTAAGFAIQFCDQYDERLYQDFARTRPSPVIDNVIELHAQKPTA